MDCAEHKNEEMPHCPSCLARYWEAKYQKLRTDFESASQEGAYRWRFQKRLATDPKDENDRRWVKICENNAQDIERWCREAKERK